MYHDMKEVKLSYRSVSDARRPLRGAWIGSSASGSAAGGHTCLSPTKRDSPSKQLLSCNDCLRSSSCLSEQPLAEGASCRSAGSGAVG